MMTKVTKRKCLGLGENMKKYFDDDDIRFVKILLGLTGALLFFIAVL